MNDSVNTLTAAVNKRRYRQFELSENSVLLGYRYRVRFNESVSECGDILVPDALTVQRIKTNRKINVPVSTLGV